MRSCVRILVATIVLFPCLAGPSRAEAPPTFVTVWAPPPEPFIFPEGLALDGSGNVFVVDAGFYTVIEYTPSGARIRDIGSGFYDAAHNVAVDGSGTIYVSDDGSNFGNPSRVWKFAANGALLGTMATQVGGAFGLALDAAGDLFVSGRFDNRVYKFSAAGTLLTSWGGPGAAPGQFSIPLALAVASDQSVYVLDAANQRVQHFSNNGAFIGTWGSAGTGDGQLESPEGICTDADGDVYVSDSANDRVQKFSANGAFLSKWGVTGSGPGQMIQPFGIGVSAGRTVYIVDRSNQRVLQYQYDNPTPAALTSWGRVKVNYR